MSLKLASLISEIGLKFVERQFPFIDDIVLKPTFVNNEPIEQYYLEVKIDKDKLGEFVGYPPNNASHFITNILTDFVIVDPHDGDGGFSKTYMVSAKIKTELNQLLKMFNVNTGGIFTDSVLFVF